MQMTTDELKAIVEKHGKWLRDEPDGSRANLSRANLYGANLYGANLSGANLYGANLSGANLYGAKNELNARLQTQIVPDEGAFIGFKKCRGEKIVKVLIPAEAKRSNATGRKCRAEFVEVLEVFGDEPAISSHDGKTEYRKGATVRCDSWCDDRWQECAGGIHFFITRAEAERY